jgi:putative intracellular protease/amidase
VRPRHRLSGGARLPESEPHVFPQNRRRFDARFSELITGQQPMSAPAFGDALVAKLNERVEH